MSMTAEGATRTTALWERAQRLIPGGFHTYNTHAPSQVVDRTRRTLDWYNGHVPAKLAGRRTRVRPVAKAREKTRAAR